MLGGKLLNEFINGIQNGKLYKYGDRERHIDEKVSEDIIGFFFMVKCRNPFFDAMGTESPNFCEYEVLRCD